ncbi:rhodanese-like domain-containing protein [Phaeocystidibacter luteus]|nr:rhodanese-like domain-containing protein [Phaeocystidibacter luteus]
MKATFFAMLVASLGLAACGQTKSENTAAQSEIQTEQEATEVIHVGPVEFEQLMADEPGLLIDVRTPGEYAGGHLEGSQLIDYNGESFRSKIDALDKDQTVYVYCRSGGRSGRSANMMRDMGFTKVVDLSGGIMAWQDAGKSVTTE